MLPVCALVLDEQTERSEAEIFAQINSPNGFIINDFIRPTSRQDTALVDDVGVIADAERFANIVVGDQHADVAFLEETNDLLDIQNGDRVDAGKGSSSRMKRGSVASARAISTRRRSPPESDAAELLRIWVICNSSSSLLGAIVDFAAAEVAAVRARP